MNNIILTIKDNELSIQDNGGYESRNESTIKLFTMALKSLLPIKLMDQVISINTQDQPVSHKGQFQQPYKVFSYSTNEDYYDTAIPDFLFDHWKQVGISDYETEVESIKSHGQYAPTKQQMFWIGNSNTNKIRSIFLDHYARKYSDLIIGKNTNWISSDGIKLTSNNFMSLPNHCDYKYLIDLPGNGWSARLKMLMFTNRPLFIVERPWKEYFFNDLKPFVHFIPVNSNLENLVQMIEWANMNPATCKEIANNALLYADNNLHRQHAINKFCDIIKSL